MQNVLPWELCQFGWPPGSTATKRCDAACLGESAPVSLDDYLSQNTSLYGSTTCNAPVGPTPARNSSTAR
jgi:hypothetical protein